MVCGSAPETGSMDESKSLEMSHWGYGNWHLQADIKSKGLLEYRYLVREAGITQRREWGENHCINLSGGANECILFDYWQQEPENPVFYTSAFTESLLALKRTSSSIKYSADTIIIKVFAPMVRRNQLIGISGDASALGNWDNRKALKMQPLNFPEWGISLKKKDLPEIFHYKFVLLDKTSENITSWEWGEPREIKNRPSKDDELVMYSGMSFKYQEAPWKGTGTAIPVFSLRSEKSWGCGDFCDLKLMIKWAALTNQQVVQLLPVNDTTLDGSWRDSYPYNANSIFALHPQYLSISSLPPLEDKLLNKNLNEKRKRLNALTEIDYEAVIELKWEYIRELYNQESRNVLESVDYIAFYENNKDWLLPYSAYCYLREEYGSPDFRSWGEYSVYDEKKIELLTDKKQKWHDKINIHCFTQYLLHKQLSEARDLAHANNVILKGDIPIGISRTSVEAWKEPYLFNMDSQIGAPPDDFSATGQNWGFPAYNWERMAAEDYKWWKRRFTKMSDYFDAYRIDHILGFFRIWEIPSHSVQGLLGCFNPAIPFTVGELAGYGFNFSNDMTEQIIDEKSLYELFDKRVNEIKDKYLVRVNDGFYKLNENYNTQVKIRDAVEDIDLKEKLYSICNEVLFVRDPQSPEMLHPRISAQKTYRYNYLWNEQKWAFDKLYNDFYYYRNIDFWRNKALQKLPPLLNSTRMLVCGEDLGMIPSCVPEVMHRLNILSLEIQRMPKTPGVLFENLNSIPYYSVCTTSTHDMNPIRAWWKEDAVNTQNYYNQVLWKQGEAPEDCTPEIAKEIIKQHLASPAMLTIFPLQDWLAIDGSLRRDNPDEERINIPANPRHYWRYRMHFTLEKLLKEDAFNENIKSLIN
jgi:4-alpha-glucanotransferase